VPGTAARRRTRTPTFLTADPLATGYRFSVDRYHQLGESGVLTSEDRVELIDGWLVEKPVQKPPHAVVVSRLLRRLSKIVPESYDLRFQVPITLATSEPEPDGVIAVGPDERYVAAHPTPKDILLVIEVADTTLAFDRGPKRLIYAAARLPVYWVVNLPGDRIEIYSNPRAGKTPAYRTRTDHERGTKVPVVINGEVVGEIAVNDILP
jgi:Uma2 family endonuclease